MTSKAGILSIVFLISAFAVLHIVFSPIQIETSVAISTLLGGVAFILMTVTIFLSTRAAFLEDVFGGLDRMYQVHKVCGVLSALFVLIHFFLAPKELPSNLLNSDLTLVPSAPLGMIAMILLVISLAITLNRKIPYHRWRLPHKGMGLVYFLVIGHFMTAPTIFFEQYSVSGIFLLVAAVVGLCSYIYNIFGLNKKAAYRYTIEKVNALERATELVLKPLNDRLNFEPGQFAFLEIQGKGWSEPHPFTITSAPEESELRFTLKVLGDWTRKVREELTPDKEVIVRGPYGKFNSKRAGNKQVWFAGGIGVTPFLSTLRDMNAADAREVILIYAVRERNEALFLEEIQAKCDALGNVKVVLLQSNQGEFARVDIMKTKLDQQLNDYDYFLCGPKPMLDGLRKDMKADGVPDANIHFEAFEFR